MNFGSFTGGNNNPSPLNLTKGSILDLTKNTPSLKNIVVGCGWDVNTSGKDNFDLDISAFLLDKNHRITDHTTQVVYFNQMTQTGIYLEGDNLTGAGDGDDERINISLEDIPNNIEEIIFNVNIFDAMKKKQTFGMIKNSYIRLLDKDNDEKELCRFELREHASNSTAVIFAKLFRSTNGWSFEAIGDNLVVQDLNQLLVRYM